MLALIALAEVFGMTLWFSATAAGPAIAAEYHLSVAAGAWVTMAVQGGFVAGTLLTAVTNLADAINARRLFAAGSLLGAIFNASIAAAPSTAVQRNVGRSGFGAPAVENTVPVACAW